MSTHESTTSPLVLDLQYHPIAGVWTQTVDARKLYESLEVERHFSDWMTLRIQEYGFLEGSDFLFFLKNGKNRGRPLHQYFLTLDMAKEPVWSSGAREADRHGSTLLPVSKRCIAGHSPRCLSALTHG